MLRNEQGRFADATMVVGADALGLKNGRAVLAGDLDEDGDTDLIVTRADGPPVLVKNDGGNANHALRLTLKGLNDNRSGVGTKVEVQAGASWQKWETVAASGYLGQSAPEVLAGLGAATQADVVRLLWPSGVVQDEVELAATKPQVIEQIDRRGSSCPIVFTWNGSGYEFVTDAIGPGVVGHWVAPGERNVPDPDEYIKIAGAQLRPKDGRLSVKFAEPMEEVIYLDQIRLFAIDHPADSDIYPHEYFAASAPPPPAEVFVTRGTRLPLGAWDETGRDVLPSLRARDGRYVEGFGRAAFKGFAALHALELDLGELPANGPVRLIMAGFTDYFTATSVFAAHQAGVTAVVPYLEALLPGGTWKKVSDDIGFPAGLRRTMTADLTGKLPPGTRRIRIWTNLKVYWDQVLIDTTAAGAVPSARTEAPLLEASLASRGFPREVPGTPAADLTYVHDQVSRVRAVCPPPRLLHAVRRRAAARQHGRRPILDFRRGRRGVARVRRERAPAAPRRLDTRLPALPPGLREGHGLLCGARPDGRPAAVPGHAHVSVPRDDALPRSEPGLPARVEHAGGGGRGVAHLQIRFPSATTVIIRFRVPGAGFHVGFRVPGSGWVPGWFRNQPGTQLWNAET